MTFEELKDFVNKGMREVPCTPSSRETIIREVLCTLTFFELSIHKVMCTLCICEIHKLFSAQRSNPLQCFWCRIDIFAQRINGGDIPAETQTSCQNFI